MNDFPYFYKSADVTFPKFDIFNTATASFARVEICPAKASINNPLLLNECYFMDIPGLNENENSKSLSLLF